MLLTAPNRTSLPTSLTVLLAPSAAVVPGTFSDVSVDAPGHAHLLAGVQRLRARAYLEDGAITSAQITPDGRHVQAADAQSWHVIQIRPNGEVVGAARYHVHAPGTPVTALGVWTSALAQDPSWRATLRAAIEDEMALAARRGIGFAEVGGWAVAKEHRGSSDALETALSTFALAAHAGGAIALTTATVRHASSRMLRRLGGRSLSFAGVELPSYFDPQYDCMMEILRFDASEPSERFQALLSRTAAKMHALPIVCAKPGTRREVSLPSVATAA